MTLTGRTVVFEGSTGAMGRKAVYAIAAAGMNVVMVTHNPASAQDICNECAGLPGKVIARGKENGEVALFEELEKEFGSVDCYINKTGGLDKPKAFEECTGEELERKLHHQITSCFETIQNVLPFVKKSKAGRVIVSVTAGALNGTPVENIIDSIARGGVVTMTKALGKEYRNTNVTFNAVAMSGMIPDHMPKPGDPHGAHMLVMQPEQIPAGRLGTSEELGALLCYLLSEESGFVTGNVYDLTGGLA